MALALVLISEILSYIEISRRFTGAKRDYNSWKELDPDYLKTMATDDRSLIGIINFASLVKAVSLFAFFVPMLQVSWILSRGGKRHLTAHVSICAMAAAGGMCELLSNLMMIGIRNTSSFITQTFNLDSWDDDTGTGWRVYEIMRLMVSGMMLWVDAFEWFCVFGIMTIIFFTVRYERKYDKNFALGKNWSILGFLIGALGLLEIISDLLRFRNWRVFTEFALVINIINMWLLVPIWLYVLAKQLSVMKASYEDWNVEDAQQEFELVNPTEAGDPRAVD